jgi:hypothetical protein
MKQESELLYRDIPRKIYEISNQLFSGFVGERIAMADQQSGKFGKAAMDYIIGENKKNNRDPQDDIKKVTSICGTPVHMKCRWDEAGSKKWTFQLKSGGKIYDIPGFLLRK